MKLKSLIMFSAAALAFAACSNDNEVIGNPDLEGTAVVKVNILTDAATRAVEPSAPVSGADWTIQDVDIESIEVTLTAGVGGDTKTFSSVAEANEYQFTGVRNPQSMTVVINHGKQDMSLEEVYNTKLAAPMYASSNEFTQHGTVKVEGEDLPLFQVNLKPAHKTALLEFSDIKHVASKDSEAACNDCTFETINICGLFLNNIKLSETAASATHYASWAAASAQGAAPTYSVIADDPLTEDVVENDFKLANGVWPAAGQCYSYNVFPGNPILTVCFNNITAADGKQLTWNPVNGGYASVSKYKIDLSSENKNAEWIEELELDENGYLKNGFKAGYVYRFKDLNIYDTAIGPTVDGGQDVVVEAVIEVEPWKLVSGTVEWN